jgi:hypothetical protein
MIVVVGSRFDAAARDLVERWPEGKAHLLTADDLTAAGWRWSDDGRTEAVAVVSGRRVRVQSIRGVLTRRPAVLPQELTTIAEADRSYVAAETTAFLTAWLSSLSCPVLNRPRGGCLSGPNWTIDLWLCTAVRLGIPVRPCRRAVPAPASAPAQEAPVDRLDRVVVVGSEVFGEVGAAQADDARRLACAAGVDLLEAQFCGPELIAATCWPDLAAPRTFEAVARYFAEASI